MGRRRNDSTNPNRGVAVSRISIGGLRDENPIYNPSSLPLPVIHSDFTFTELGRAVEDSRRSMTELGRWMERIIESWILRSDGIIPIYIPDTL